MPAKLTGFMTAASPVSIPFSDGAMASWLNQDQDSGVTLCPLTPGFCLLPGMSLHLMSSASGRSEPEELRTPRWREEPPGRDGGYVHLVRPTMWTLLWVFTKKVDMSTPDGVDGSSPA